MTLLEFSVISLFVWVIILSIQSDSFVIWKDFIPFKDEFYKFKYQAENPPYFIKGAKLHFNNKDAVVSKVVLEKGIFSNSYYYRVTVNYCNGDVVNYYQEELIELIENKENSK